MMENKEEEEEEEDESQQQQQCRICGEEETKENSALFSPCLCNGSIKMVHMHCLRHWRLVSTRADSKYRCEQCHHPYTFRYSCCSSFLIHPVTISCTTFLIWFFLLLYVSYVLYQVGTYFRHEGKDMSMWTIMMFLVFGGTACFVLGICFYVLYYYDKDDLTEEFYGFYNIDSDMTAFESMGSTIPFFFIFYVLYNVYLYIQLQCMHTMTYMHLTAFEVQPRTNCIKTKQQ